MKLDKIKEKIWRVDLKMLPKWRAYKIRFLRILILTSQGFTKSQIQIGASSLTYYTLLGLVPIIAFMIGIARGFQVQETLHKWVINRFPEQKVILDKIFEFATSSIQSTQQGVIAVVSILLLFWAGIKIILYIESNLNIIWEVTEKRSFAKRFSNYLAILVLSPLIIVLLSGVTGYVTAILSTISEQGFFQHISDLIVSLANLIPFLLLCLVFTFLYIYMPNTRVHVWPALIAGVITGLIYQGIQWVYLYFQIGVTKYNAIYGTFAALPLFLVWIHLSWVIVLLGAKITFSIQNVDAFDFISENVPLSYRARTILYLRIAHFCIKNFAEGQRPPTSIEISNRLSISHPLTNHILHKLVVAKVLSEVKRDKNGDPAFMPSRSVDQLTIKRVLDMIYTKGVEIPLPPTPEISVILTSLEKFSKEIEESDGNILIKNI